MGESSSRSFCCCYFFMWLAVLSSFLRRAFVFVRASVFHILIHEHLICEQRLLAECGDRSMKSINSPAAEVQYA